MTDKLETLKDVCNRKGIYDEEEIREVLKKRREHYRKLQKCSKGGMLWEELRYWAEYQGAIAALTEFGNLEDEKVKKECVR